MSSLISLKIITFFIKYIERRILVPFILWRVVTRGQGGAHFTTTFNPLNFTQILPLVKWKFMNGAFLTVTALNLYDEECLERS